DVLRSLKADLGPDFVAVRGGCAGLAKNTVAIEVPAIGQRIEGAGKVAAAAKQGELASLKDRGPSAAGIDADTWGPVQDADVGGLGRARSIGIRHAHPDPVRAGTIQPGRKEEGRLSRVFVAVIAGGFPEDTVAVQVPGVR